MFWPPAQGEAGEGTDHRALKILPVWKGLVFHPVLEERIVGIAQGGNFHASDPSARHGADLDCAGQDCALWRSHDITALILPNA